MAEDVSNTLAFLSFCRLWKSSPSIDSLDLLYSEILTQAQESIKKFSSTTFEDVLSYITFNDDEFPEFDADNAFDEFFEETATFEQNFHVSETRSNSDTRGMFQHERVRPSDQRRKLVDLGCEKICNLYLSAIKTPGYGKKFGFSREKEETVYYNNCFDPRLQFKGLLDERLLFRTDKKVEQNLFLALDNISDILQDHISKYTSFLSVLKRPHHALLSGIVEQIFTPDDDPHTPSHSPLDVPKFPVEINVKDKEEIELIKRVLDDDVQLIWTDNCSAERIGAQKPISCPVSKKWPMKPDFFGQLDFAPAHESKDIVKTLQSVSFTPIHDDSEASNSEEIDQYLTEIWSEINGETNKNEDISEISISSPVTETLGSPEKDNAGGDDSDDDDDDESMTTCTTEDELNSMDENKNPEEMACISQKKCTSQPELCKLAECSPDSRTSNQQQTEDLTVNMEDIQHPTIKQCPSDSALYKSPSRQIPTQVIRDATGLVGQPIPVQTTNRQDIPIRNFAQVQRSSDYSPAGWHSQHHQTWTYINATGRPQTYLNRPPPVFQATNQVSGAHWSQPVQDAKAWFQQNQVPTLVPHVNHHLQHHQPQQQQHPPHPPHPPLQFCQQPKFTTVPAQNQLTPVPSWQLSQLTATTPVTHLPGHAGGQAWPQWQQKQYVPATATGQGTNQQQIQAQIFQQQHLTKMPPGGGLPQTYNNMQHHGHQAQMSAESTPYQQIAPQQSWQTWERPGPQKKSYPPPTRPINPIVTQSQKPVTTIHVTTKDSAGRPLITTLRPPGVNVSNLVQIKVQDLFESAAAHQGKNNTLHKPVSFNQPITSTQKSIPTVPITWTRLSEHKELAVTSSAQSGYHIGDHSCGEGGVQPVVKDNNNNTTSHKAIGKLEIAASMLCPFDSGSETSHNQQLLLNANSKAFVPGIKTGMVKRLARVTQEKPKVDFMNQTSAASAAASTKIAAHGNISNPTLWTSNAINFQRKLSAWKNLSQGK